MPKLHLKANFFASREGWDSLVVRPEMVPVLAAYLGQLIARDTAEARRKREDLQRAAGELEAGFRQALAPGARERMIYYLMVGSANQDYRSAYMDGEAAVLLSGWSSVVSLVDLGLIINLSYWIDDLGMLDALIPPPSELQRALARQVRPAL